MKYGILEATLALLLAQIFASATMAAAITQEEAHAIGVEAYLYFYSPVTMDVTRLQLTNMDPASAFGGPANAFKHVRAFPAADMRAVVRPNFDTLYSSGWLDLTKGPVIVSAPDTAGRYYLLPMLDMWTDVFAVPGKRTTGTGAYTFAIAGPGLKGTLPAGVARINAPTARGWIIGRTQTNGKADYSAVHVFQDGMSAVPLSSFEVCSVSLRSGRMAGPASSQPSPAATSTVATPNPVYNGILLGLNKILSARMPMDISTPPC